MASNNEWQGNIQFIKIDPIPNGDPGSLTDKLFIKSIEFTEEIPANTAPIASNVTIIGTAQVGQVLTGNYTYSDADGDLEGASRFRWLRNRVPIAGATTKTYKLVTADQGTLIIFEVTPVAQTGVITGVAVQSSAVGPITSSNTAPTASNVTITGTVQVGQVLIGNYTYSDADGDLEGASRFRWLRNWFAIPGATAKTYKLVLADRGARITFEVTPVALTGVLTGKAVRSPAVGPVIRAYMTPISSFEQEKPDSVILGLNYPNPFNPETYINFALPEKAMVVIEVYNLLGQKVRTLLVAEKEAGSHHIRWDGKDESGIEVSSGIYIYTIQAISEKTKTIQKKRMTLIR